MSDLISRHDVRMITSDGTAYSETWNFDYEQGFADALRSVLALPSAEPTYTDEQIQKMQEMEQAQLDKAFELGQEVLKAVIIRCKDCKWSDFYTARDGKQYCYCLETGNGGRTENDYCSYAERETDEE